MSEQNMFDRFPDPAQLHKIVTALYGSEDTVNDAEDTAEPPQDGSAAVPEKPAHEHVFTIFTAGKILTTDKGDYTYRMCPCGLTHRLLYGDRWVLVPVIG